MARTSRPQSALAFPICRPNSRKASAPPPIGTILRSQIQARRHTCQKLGENSFDTIYKLRHICEAPLMISPRIIATVRDYNDLIAAFRARKAELGLADKVVDELGDLTNGHTDKILGPRRAKNLSAFTLGIFMDIFGVDFLMVENADKLARIKRHHCWRERDKNQIRLRTYAISSELIDRIKPAFYLQLAERMTEGRKKIDPEIRRRIAVKAGKASGRARRAAKRRHEAEAA
jgi:hypothetical protein